MTAYGIDQLKDSMVKILDPDSGSVCGSGFIIHHDGYLVTCHHVIYLLNELRVEYGGKTYEAKWCEYLSNPDVDIAILKIDVDEATPAQIINPRDLSTSVIVYGFPRPKLGNFPGGHDLHVASESIEKSAPINTVSTYPPRKASYVNPWNKQPRPRSRFLAHRIHAMVEPGTSGGAVLAEDLGGVVGVVQCSGRSESYAIRWDNIKDSLDRLGLEPEKNATCQFLEEVEARFKHMKLFHSQQEIVLEKHYIPIEVTGERKYRHEIETSWGYVESDEELKRAYALKGMEGDSAKNQVPWGEIRKANQKIMVLADPGMGKSTLLRMEAQSTAQTERQRLLASTKTVYDTVYPLLLRLSDLETGECEVIDTVPQLIERDYPNTSAAIADLLKEKLRVGTCLLLLDGLDEVPRERRLSLAQKLNRFAANYSCPVICTSRIVGYSSDFLAGSKEVEIVPFRDKQVKQYVDSWFANAASSIEDTSATAQGLLRELKNKPQVRGLTQNPLLLSLLCSLYQVGKLSLPARRVQIYGEVVHYILGTWSQNKRPQPTGRIIAKTRLLEELACHFSCEGKDVFSAEELFDRIEEHLQGDRRPTVFRDSKADELMSELSEDDGILQRLDKQGDRHIFMHRTFQEYFTASYLKRLIEQDQYCGLDAATQHLWEYDWHETLSLLVGSMKDPIPLLKAITSEKDDIFFSMLILAGQCIAECEDNPDPIMSETIHRIYELWRSNPDLDFIQPKLVALGQASFQLVKWLVEALNAKDGDFSYRAARALGEISTLQALKALIDALNSDNYDVRKNAIWGLRMVGSPQAVEALIHAVGDDDDNVRKNAIEALGQIGSPEAIDALSQAFDDENDTVWYYAARALRSNGSPEAVEAFIDALSSDEVVVRGYAEEALMKIASPRAVEALAQLEGWSETKLWALGETGSRQAVEELIQALSSPISNVFLRRKAAWALGRTGSPQAIEALARALSVVDEVEEVRVNAAVALGKIGSRQAVEALIHALQDKDFASRVYAAHGLGKTDSPQAVKALIHVLNSKSKYDKYDRPNKYVRHDAAKALGEIGSPKAVEALCQALHDEDEDVGLDAAYALARISSADALEPLIHVLNSKSKYDKYDRPNEYDRQKAAKALGEIGSPKAVDALCQALHDEDEDVGQYAAHALGNIGDPRALKSLVQALNHGHWKVRMSAVDAVRRIGSPQAVEALIHALNNEATDVRHQATRGLAEMGTLQTLEQLIYNPEIDIYCSDIFLLARKMAIRYNKEKTDIVPVYREIIKKHKPKSIWKPGTLRLPGKHTSQASSYGTSST